MTDPLVMYLVVRESLGMSPGKIAAQVGHAVQWIVQRHKQGDSATYMDDWLASDYRKVVLGADEAQWRRLHELEGEPFHVVVDDRGQPRDRDGHRLLAHVQEREAGFAKEAEGAVMPRWFIDGGAHRGGSIDLARHIDGDVSIIAIEPASECWADLVAKGVLLIPAALSDSVGHANLYRGDYEVSSTIVKEKKSGGISAAKAERVPTITLGSVLRALPLDSEIIVKMDVEGAEYPILEQSLSDGILRRVKTLYVDFHGGRIAGFSRSRHVQLVRSLLDAGFDLPKWIPGEMRVVPWGERWITEETW